MTPTRPTWRTRMRPRSPTEEHRSATPLELFFDLCFVVAVAQAGSRLHHELAEGQFGDAILSYSLVFFAIWWAWMNFSWFASAYDTDDIPYRVAVFVQIAGALILAAGVPRAFDDRDFDVAVLGYVVMRVALVAQWLRAAAGQEEGRRCALRYAAGISACQVWWVSLLAVHGEWQLAGFAVGGAAEMLVPVWAERTGATAWHPRHIAERYGLFTLIVLGESVLAASVAIQAAIDTGESLADVAPVAVGGLLIVFSMWWMYFEQPVDAVIDHARSTFGSSSSAAFAWGYGHLIVFASAAAVGAGLEVAVDRATHHTELSDAQAGATIAVPVALYVLSVWALHKSQKPPGLMRTFAVPVAAALVMAASGLGEPVLAIGVIVATLIVLWTAIGHRYSSA